MAVLDPVAGVIARTAANAGVTSLVGGRVSVYGDHRSSAAGGTPYIVVEQVGGEDTNHLLGHAGAADASVQVSCVGNTYASAQAVRAAVLAVWRTPYPVTVTVGADSIKILSAQIGGQNDLKPRPDDGGGAPRYVNMTDIELRYETA